MTYFPVGRIGDPSYGPLLIPPPSLPAQLEWPFVVSIPAAIVALIFAVAVGLFFGYYPARRASKLDPIDALRYD